MACTEIDGECVSCSPVTVKPSVNLLHTPDCFRAEVFGVVLHSIYLDIEVELDDATQVTFILIAKCCMRIAAGSSFMLLKDICSSSGVDFGCFPVF